jgi:DNA-binding NarL/FixJ family response regulator
MTTLIKKTVAVCETQPIAAEGIRGVLATCDDLEYTHSAESLNGAMDLLRHDPPDILIVDKGFGIQSILDWTAEVRMRGIIVAIVVWGVSMSEAEALRFLQSGARGIVRKTATLAVLVACLRSVAQGRNWMEDCVFKDAARADRYPRSELTQRERQVLELVEQGYKNKEIAAELGIRPGTVKIHLKHIFEKTGVRGRYGLALNGLKDKGILSLTA